MATKDKADTEAGSDAINPSLGKTSGGQSRASANAQSSKADDSNPTKINPGEDIASATTSPPQNQPNQTPNVNDGQPTPGLPGKDPEALKKTDEGGVPPAATLKEFADQVEKDKANSTGDPLIPAKRPKARTAPLKEADDSYEKLAGTDLTGTYVVKDGHELEEIRRLYKGGEKGRAAQYIKHGLNLQGDALDAVLNEMPDLRLRVSSLI